MLHNDHILIFSACKGAPSVDNNARHGAAINTLVQHGIPYMELNGQYNGTPELVILVLAKHRAMVERLVKDYDQECYLESHNDRHTELVYADGTRQVIGTLAPVSKEKALTLPSWTYRADIDQYYAVS